MVGEMEIEIVEGYKKDRCRRYHYLTGKIRASHQLKITLRSGAAIRLAFGTLRRSTIFLRSWLVLLSGITRNRRLHRLCTYERWPPLSIDETK
jgi:hypothetical protein